MDHLKRRTIKQMAGLAVATASAATAGSVSANDQGTFETDTGIGSQTSAELSAIDVYTRVSSTTNDLEVVVANSGKHTARITQMTPSHTVINRGTFDFAKLMSNGTLTLAPGQSVTVPMTPHTVALNGSTSAQPRAETLISALRSSFSVIVDNQSFARVNVIENMRLV